MPKKKKQGEEKNLNEGRPIGLTFGDFLVTATKTQQLAQRADGENSNQDTPLLCCAKEEPPVDLEDIKTIFYICRTKKGGLPVKVESRSSGKKVTLIEHVLGDGKKLLQELKTKFGTGGVFNDGVIELQGDCKTKVMKYFGDNKQLLRPYGSKIQ